MLISYEKFEDEIIIDDGEERRGIPVEDFEIWLQEGNRLYHGMAEPDEYETPTGRWSLESYWDCAPESMILQHLNDYNVTADHHSDD